MVGEYREIGGRGEADIMNEEGAEDWKGEGAECGRGTRVPACLMDTSFVNVYAQVTGWLGDWLTTGSNTIISGERYNPSRINKLDFQGADVSYQNNQEDNIRNLFFSSYN